MKTPDINISYSCGIALAFTSFLTGCNDSNDQNRPNILFIAVDDLRPELNCYGVDYVISPNIDKLASDGLLFNNAYCQSAVSNPSRASLMTGMRPDAIEVWDLNTDFRRKYPEVITIPMYFKQNGYKTLSIGKIFHNIFPDSVSWDELVFLDKYPFDPDAVYRGKLSTTYQELRKSEILAAGWEKRHKDVFGHWYLKAHATECEELPDNAYYDGAQTDYAVRKLKDLKKEGKPFFFGIGYYRPHLPFNAPKKYWDMYDPDSIPLANNSFVPVGSPSMAINNLRELKGYVDFKDAPRPWEKSLSTDEARLLKHGYLSCVSYIDAQIGRLLSELKELGLDQNTIIVLWGDHGWKLGEHNSWGKMTNYGIDTRSPLIISTPESRGKKLKTGSLVEFVDIYPTLCELAGLDVPSGLDGTSLVPLFSDTSIVLKEEVFSQYLREGIWSAPDTASYMGYSVRTTDYLYVRWINWKTKQEVGEELYDLILDPSENINIASREDTIRQTISSLRSKMPANWQR